MAEMKKSNVKKKTTKKKDDAPVIKKIVPEKVEDIVIEDKYQEESDNKAIIFIAVAILIVVGTIVGLIVGCEKPAEQPEKPEEEVKVPVEEEEVVKEEEEEVVKKVVKKTNTKKEQPVKYYEVLFLEQDGDVVRNTYRTDVKSGNKVHVYTPNGSACTYHKTNENVQTNLFDFNTKITKDTTIYMFCNRNIYNLYLDDVLYDEIDWVESDEYELPVLEMNNDGKIFLGWYTNSEGTGSKIKVVNLDNIDALADADKNVKLYSVYGDPIKLNYYVYDSETGEYVDTPEVVEVSRDEELAEYTLKTDNDLVNACPANTTIKGYKTTADGNVSVFVDKIMNLRDKGPEINLYVNCGTTSVTYVDGETHVYGNEESLDDFKLPETPADVGIKTPNYYDKSDKENESALLVVADTEETLEEDEIRLSDVVANAASGYEPQVGDYVIMKDKVFVGWKIVEEDEETEEDTTPETTDIAEDTTDTTVGTDESSDETITDEEDSTTEVVEEELLDDTYKPEEGTDVKIEAVWEEQPKEDVEEDVVVEDTTTEVPTEEEDVTQTPEDTQTDTSTEVTEA